MPRAPSWLCVLVLGLLAWPAAADPVPTAKDAEPVEDPLPTGALLRIGSTRFRCGAVLNCVTFSPDGKHVVGASQVGSIHVWDRNSGRELRSWQRPGHMVTHLAYSADGKFLAASSQQGVVYVSDPGTGRDLFNRQLNQFEPSAFAWAGDKIVMAGTRDGTIRVVQIPSGKEERSWNSGVGINLAGLACSPDGKRVVALSQNAILTCWDIASGRESTNFENPGAGRIRSLQGGANIGFSPDGQWLAAALDRQIVVWDATTGKIARRINDNMSFGSSICFLPNSRFLAINNRAGKIQIVGVNSGTELRAFSAGATIINSIAVSPDGRTMAAASGQTLRFWDIATSKELFADTGHHEPVLGLVFVKDKEHLVSWGQDALRCWNCQSGREIDNLNSRANSAQPALASESDSVRFANFSAVYAWQPGSKQTAARTLMQIPASQFQPSLSSDGRVVAALSRTANNQGEIRIYNVDTGKETRHIDAGTGFPRMVVLSPAGRHVVCLLFDQTGGIDLSPTIWDTTTGQKRRPILAQMNRHFFDFRMIFSPDTRLLATFVNNSEIHIWEIASGEERAVIPRTAISAQAFSPDSRYFAWGTPDGTLRVFDLWIGLEMPAIAAHRGPIQSLAFSADGTRLATGGADTTVLIWDFAALLRTLPAITARTTKPSARELEQSWNELLGGNGMQANQAIWTLAQAPEATMSLFREKLKPVKGPDPADIERWIGELGDTRFAVREKATKSLAEAGESAREPLKTALEKGPSAEAGRRITMLLKNLDDSKTSRQLQPLRAIEVLERIGQPEARQLLADIGQQTTDPDVKREIDFTLARWQKK
ncbi:MAG TPA: hypothetical protein VGZ47_16875 [Gemmataceae bacterium]|nr:hypothetical protein [Gemmataceae bacterium]